MEAWNSVSLSSMIVLNFVISDVYIYIGRDKTGKKFESGKDLINNIFSSREILLSNTTSRAGLLTS